MDKLLPCPFCGEKAEVKKIRNEYFVQCLGNKCCYGKHNDLSQEGYLYEKDAINLWNTRAKPSVMSELEIANIINNADKHARLNTDEIDEISRALAGRIAKGELDEDKVTDIIRKNARGQYAFSDVAHAICLAFKEGRLTKEVSHE